MASGFDELRNISQRDVLKTLDGLPEESEHLYGCDTCIWV